jgi:SulP family sulfate permease
MSAKNFDDLHPFPLWNDILNYRLDFFKADLIAALSVVLLALPQAMAYAFAAELPLSAGIFSAIFGTIFTASFGSSRILITGPTNTVAIVIQSGTSEILNTYYKNISIANREMMALNIVLQIVLLIGVFQMLIGVLKLGKVTHFASRSVVLGYLAGAAFAIAVTQLYYFLGIPEMNETHPIFYQGWYILQNFFTLHLPTTLIGISCLALLIVLQRFSAKVPGAVIVFVLASFAVAVFHLSPDDTRGMFDTPPGQRIEKITLLDDIGSVYSEMPKIALPPFEMRILVKVVPLAFAITLLSMLEATSIGRAYSRANEPPYSENQEVFGLGISNLFSAFLGAMPSSGSFTRSALNYTAGAHSRMSAIFSGLFLFVIVISLGFLITQIPLTALSALMILTAYAMVNFKDLAVCLKATKIDGLVVFVTFMASTIFTLDVALYIGVVLSVILYLKQAAVPYFAEYTFNNVGKLRPMDPEDDRPDPRICIIHAEGEMFFAAAEQLKMKIRRISEDESIKIIILQVMNARHIDASVCLALREIYHFLRHKEHLLLVSGVTPEIQRILKNAGLVEELGEKSFFLANEQLPSEPTRSAYAHAKSLLA